MLQILAGDNEVVFGRETKVFDQWIRHYMLTRRDAVDRDGRFRHDRYYMDAIVARLTEVEGRLRGDEKRIFQARIRTRGKNAERIYFDVGRRSRA